MSEFAAAESALKSYALGSMMPYIVHQDFLTCYRQCNGNLDQVHFCFRDKTGNSLDDINISLLQLRQDDNALFGAIVSLCQGKYATAVIEKHEADAHGIAVYIDLVGKYRQPNTVRTDAATEKLNQKFSEFFPGGLQQFLLQFEEAYAMLDKVEKETAA